MINGESSNIKSNEYFYLPKGFIKWFIIISKIRTDVSQSIEYCLERGYIPSAIEIFEKETKENIDKVWH